MEQENEIILEPRVSSAVYKCCAHVTLKRPLNKSKPLALTCPRYSWPRILPLLRAPLLPN